MPFTVHVHNTGATIELKPHSIPCPEGWPPHSDCYACGEHLCGDAVAATAMYVEVSESIRWNLHEDCAHKLYGWTRERAEMLQ